MPFRLLPIISFLVLLAFFGCQSPAPKPPAPPPVEHPQPEKKSPDPVVFNNSLALLYDLLNEEKDLSKLLIIKRNSAELKVLVVNISKTSGAGAKLLKSFEKKGSGLEFKETDLPPGEKAARKAISKTKEHLLLHLKDQEFEFQLLLTQSEALNYGAHLALVALENDPQPDRAAKLSGLARQLADLHEQVLAMLRKSH